MVVEDGAKDSDIFEIDEVKRNFLILGNRIHESLESLQGIL